LTASAPPRNANDFPPHSAPRLVQASTFWAGGFRSVPSALERWARERPDENGFTFLRDGDLPSGSFTWRTLDQAVATRAGTLARAGLAGRRALLISEPGLEFVATFVACLRAGVVAVPVPVPRRASAAERLRGIAEDADTDVVLTDTPTLPTLVDAGLRGLRFIRSDVAGAPDGPRRDPDPHEPALLQYTSGSTSCPKGVIVTHANLWHQSRELDELWPTQPGERTVSWLPMFHDMGLMFGLVMPIFRGSQVTLFAPEAFVRRPIRWLRAISGTGAVTSIAPNFAYERCLEKVSAEERSELDLSSWRYAINGAEPVSAETMRRFIDTFSECGLNEESVVAGYGLAEATLKVAGTARGPSLALNLSVGQLRAGRAVRARAGEPAVAKVECGTSSPGTEIRIIDPVTAMTVPDGTVGEIWVSGPCVCAGYWNRPQETEQTFRARIAGDPDGPAYLRTGDLGFVADGDLFVTGRRKDLLILRGENHYPQDIEATAAAAAPGAGHPTACAFAVDGEREERLVVAVELDPSTSPGDADREAIATAIWQEHGVVPAALVFLRRGRLPKTTSGKLRRSAAAQAYLDGTLKALPGSGEVPEPGAVAAHRELDDLLGWIDDWALRRVNTMLMDERRSIPPHVVLDLARRGVLGMQVPRAEGGLGLDDSGMLRVLERLAGVNLCLATFVCGNNSLGIRPVLRYAAGSVRQRLAPELARGQALAAFALTEPGAGSFVPSISSTARRTDDGFWRLDGVKSWSGNAAGSNVIVTFAQAYDEHGRGQGMTAFLIDTDDGAVRMGEEELTMGMRPMVHNTVVFDGTRVGDDRVLGEVGGGFDVANDAMMRARLMIGGLCLGAMKRCLGVAVGYAQRRPISTGLMIDNPVVRETLSDAVAAVRAVEAIVYGTAALFDAHRPVDELASLVLKVVCPELLWKVVDDTVQVLGGRGYIETNEVSRFLRDARVLRIFEGPTESLRMHLGSLVLNRRSVLRTLVEDELGDPDAARVLSSMIDDVMITYEQWSFGDAVEGTRLLHDRLGEVVAAGVVDVLVHRTVDPADDGSGARAWAARRLQRAYRIATERPVMLEAGRLFEMTAAEVTRAYKLAQRDPNVRLDVDALVAGRDTVRDPQPPQPPSPAADSVPIPAGPPEPPGDRGGTAATRRAEPPEGDVTTWRRWLTDWIAGRADVSVDQVQGAASLQRYGIDSVAITELVADLDDDHDLDVPAALVWENPTIEALAREIAVLAGHAPGRS
jgi:acyl-CoA synthetase (AMP-forming)/AMP-acid ligase II/alkylation response protein AidB-like acyl-CoA dehydrogenase/acyl carrier protein